MPNIGSVGWVNIAGATHPEISHNASTIETTTTVPDGHYCVLYGDGTSSGTIHIGADIEFRIGVGAQVKIKPFADV